MDVVGGQGFVGDGIVANRRHHAGARIDEIEPPGSVCRAGEAAVGIEQPVGPHRDVAEGLVAGVERGFPNAPHCVDGQQARGRRHEQGHVGERERRDVCRQGDCG